MPHITLSFGRDSGDQNTSGDLTALGLGLAALVAWAFAGPLGIPTMLAYGHWLLQPVSEVTALAMRLGFVGSLALFLIIMGCTNQRYLRFYVDRMVLMVSAVLCAAGTAAMALCGLAGGAAATLLACTGSVLAGAGAAVLMALWATSFARYEFPTITLNAVMGMVLGIVCAMALTNWIPDLIAAAVTLMLALATATLLWHMTPIPYYRRQEMPIFHALQVSQAPFLVRLGIPAIIFGIALGVLGSTCVRGAFCTGDMASDLMVGAACALCVVIFVAAVALLKNEAHWDTLFRFMLPLVGLGMIGIPLFYSEYQLGAVFLMAVGLAVLLTLLWVMFSDISQEFRLSPIFVFGIGAGLLMAGALAGALLTPQVPVWHDRDALDWTGLAMVAVVCLMVAGSLMPRQRTMRRMLASDRVEDATGLNQLLVDSTVRRGKEATDEQNYAAGDRSETPAPQGTADEASPDDAGSEPGDPADTPAETDDQAKDEAAKPQKGSFYKRCEQIADQYLLSRRETEVLFLLAKGHKAGFIEDKLCVSRSTAKTHINHIYKKLNIHTQQELLNMVEDRPRPHSEEPQPSAHHGF